MLKRSFLFSVLFLISLTCGVKGQLIPVNHNGIPIIFYTSSNASSVVPEANRMASMGADVVEFANLTPTDETSLQGKGLKFIPSQLYDHNGYTVNKVINQYTDAHYTCWKAFVPDNTNGDAVWHMTEYGENFTEGNNTFVKSRTGRNETIMDGPGYPQEIYYRHYNESGDFLWTGTGLIHYKAVFKLKLKETGISGGGSFDPTSPIGRIKVTIRPYYRMADTLPYIIDFSVPAHEIEGKDLYLSDFTGGGGLNEWKTIEIPYDFSNVPRGTNLQGLIMPEYRTTPSFTVPLKGEYLWSAAYVEFQVDWGGVTNYDICIDEVTVSDRRGRELLTPSVKTSISAAADMFTSCPISYWYPLDEPRTIDNFEPFRIVNEITTAKGRPLFASIASSWNGNVGDTQDGALKINYVSEFNKRAKPKFIQYNAYFFNKNNGTRQDYYDKLIAMKHYKANKMYNLDPNFGWSLQAGSYTEIKDGNLFTLLVYPENFEVNYHLNLGLLLGAKKLLIWNYFSNKHTTAGFTNEYSVKGLIDENGIITPTGSYFQNTLVPRIKGAMGETFMKLKPGIQLEGVFYNNNDRQLNMAINTSGASNTNIMFEKVQGITSPSNGNNSVIVDVDFGNFTEINNPNAKYYMFINRSYNPTVAQGQTVPANWNEFSISITGLTEYNNWALTSYKANKDVATIYPVSNGNAVYTCLIDKGDMILFRLGPVFEMGGDIRYNETVSGIRTLDGPLAIRQGSGSTTLTLNNDCRYTIKSSVNIAQGCTLYVKSGAEVYAYSDITVEQGGTIKVEPGAKLTFFSGKILKVYGKLNASGKTPSGTINPVIIDFNSRTGSTGEYNNGIKIFSGGDATLDNVKIMNAFSGVYSYSSVASITNSEIYNCHYGLLFSVMQNRVSGTPKPIVDNNIVHDNLVGMGFSDECAVYITRCQIYNNSQYGVLCYKSSPAFGYANHPGSNYIRNNTVGMDAYYSSVPFLGNIQYANWGGQNAFKDNSGNNLQVRQSTSVTAHNNFWRVYPASPKITYDATSSVDFLYELEENPFDNLSQSMTNVPSSAGIQKETLNKEITGSLKDIVKEADKYYYQDEFRKAMKLSSRIMEEYPDSAAAIHAMDIFARSSIMAADKDSMKQYFKSLIKNHGNSRLNAELEIMLAMNDTSKVIENLDKVLGKYSDTLIIESVYYHKIFHSVFNLMDFELASSIYKDAGDKFRRSHSGELVHGMLEGTMNKNMNKIEGKSEVDVLPEEYKLLGNYPNPFNPYTIIKYSLPYNSNIEISIYDIMGREIRTISMQSQSKGYKEALWNGLDNSGHQVSSGIYIYRFRAKSIETSDKEFIKTAKMMMIK